METAGRLTLFKTERGPRAVSFVGDGILWGAKCEVYEFDDDNTRDLRVVSVEAGRSTVNQMLVGETKLMIDRLDGSGTVEVGCGCGRRGYYDFSPESGVASLELKTDQAIRLHADGMSRFVCAVVFEPPFADENFQRLDS